MGGLIPIPHRESRGWRDTLYMPLILLRLNWLSGSMERTPHPTRARSGLVGSGRVVGRGPRAGGLLGSWAQLSRVVENNFREAIKREFAPGKAFTSENEKEKSPILNFCLTSLLSLLLFESESTRRSLVRKLPGSSVAKRKNVAVVSWDSNRR